MRFSHLIWDFDGTLLNTYPAFGRAFAAAMATLGKHIEAVHAECLAWQSLSHCATILATESGLEAQRLLEAFGKCYTEVLPAAQPLLWAQFSDVNR